jgi:hypothetical protein
MSKQRRRFTFDDESVAVVVFEKGEASPRFYRMTAQLNAVARRLALMGLAEYLKNAEDADAAYDQLATFGMSAFAPRAVRSFTPSRAQRVQAIAAMKNTTPQIINKKLKSLGPDKAAEILNRDDVIDRARELVAPKEVEL